mgnify:CR=1 FL=1
MLIVARLTKRGSRWTGEQGSRKAEWLSDRIYTEVELLKSSIIKKKIVCFFFNVCKHKLGDIHCSPIRGLFPVSSNLLSNPSTQHPEPPHAKNVG